MKPDLCQEFIQFNVLLIFFTNLPLLGLKGVSYGGPQLSHQIQIAHIKYKIVTSNTNYSHQKQISHFKYKILTPNTNYSQQIQITHIKNKLPTSKTRLNSQQSENENYIQFSLGLGPTTILFLHVVLSSRRDVLQQLRKKC